MPTGDVVQWIQLGGTVAALGFFVMAFLRGWIVPSAQYADMKRDRDDWKRIALTGTDAAEKALAQMQRRSTREREAAQDL